MERDSLVSINIFNSENKILNKSTVPMLYYWNGINDVLDDLSNDEHLLKYAKTLFINPTDYLDLMISYFYFKYNDNDEEVYADNTLDIQDIITLDKFESDYIVLYYLLNHFKTLYKNSFKDEYISEDNDAVNNILIMYRAIKDKFKTRLTKITIMQWIRSVLLDESHFNGTNSDFIYNKLNEILKDEEE